MPKVAKAVLSMIIGLNFILLAYGANDKRLYAAGGIFLLQALVFYWPDKKIP
jgi:hypothetical protein